MPPMPSTRMPRPRPRPVLAALVLVLALAADASLACINETGTNRSGQAVSLGEPVDVVRASLVTPKRSSPSSIQWARRVTADARRDPSFDNLNQLAVVLIRFGRPQDAVTLLRAVERRFPGRWQTAPNLGTAYELAGDNANALVWIREGLKRNAADHAGSEWLHVAILEAKLHERARVLDLDFGPGPLPRLPARLPAGNDGRPVSPEQLRQALWMQASERAQFVAAPDPVMAELLVDWAHMELLVGTMEYAEVVYPAAERYGWPDRGATVNGRREAERIRRSRKS